MTDYCPKLVLRYASQAVHSRSVIATMYPVIRCPCNAVTSHHENFASSGECDGPEADI